MMRVGFVLREDLPRDDGQRARRRDGGHLQAALRADSMEEGAQWAWRLRRRPGGLDQHRARVRAAAFADVAVPSRLQPALTHTGIQPKVAHELLRRPKARDVADGGAESDRDDRIDAGDGQELLDGGVRDDRFTEQTIDRLQILTSRSSSRRRCSTPSRSSIGNGCSASQLRPLRPKRSAAGHRGMNTCAAPNALRS